MVKKLSRVIIFGKVETGMTGTSRRFIVIAGDCQICAGLVC